MSKGQPRKMLKSGKPSFPVPIIIGFGILLIAAALLATRKSGSVVAIEVNGAPSLRADPMKIDFGDVQLGRTVTAVFALSNVGDQPLELTRAPYVEVVEGC